MSNPVAIIIDEECILCEMCADICPEEVIIVDALEQGLVGRLVYNVDIIQELCDGCGRCVDICPSDAIKLVSV
jgi:Formate hydrogenlyase subunit 6/NADH:ubiquinone oxidoreductase 23 kD subunit (chain I)